MSNLLFKVILSPLGGLSRNLSLFLTFLFLLPNAQAQIIPDATLPVNSIVIPQGNTNLIEGGTQTGNNLFHSFREFSVPTGTTAFFNNNLQIQNIFTRVTGNDISNIDGVIRSNGNANFFLINPNGIIFGSNAKLNIGGSFLATTANSIIFRDGIEFSAKNPQNSTLLTVSVPIGLQYGNIGAGEIRIQGKGQDLYNQELGTTNNFDRSLNPLEVPSGNTLAFIGGNIIIDGGIIQAAGSSVQLGGLSGEGTVSINADGTFTFPDVSRSDISIINQAGINVVSPDGGSITINARNLDISGESLISGGIPTGKGTSNTIVGDISLNATGAIAISASRIENSVNTDSLGKSGNINITANSLALSPGALLDASIYGQGSGGNITVVANDTISFQGGNDRSSGAVQTIVGAKAQGNAGSISITTDSLFLTNGAALDVSTRGNGNAGNITVIASDTVSFEGVGEKNPGGVNSSVGSSGVGKGGDITIITKSFSATNGAGLTANTFGQGNAGSISIVASDSVDFDGQGNNGLQSGALSAVNENAEGDAGSIKITSNTLNISNKALLESSSTGNGAAGNIIVAANTINLNNQAQISTDSLGKVTATTKEQGNVTLNAESLILQNNSTITTNARGSKIVGGNIIINTDTLTALVNSDINANSLNDRGGTITINAQAIFGSQSRTREELQILLNTTNIDTSSSTLLSTSDITATGADSSLSGIVSVNTPNINPSGGLVELSGNLLDVTTQVASTCRPDRQNNRFVVFGRGGLPPSPNEPLGDEATWIDIRGEAGEQNNRGERKRKVTQSFNSPIVEAQGWAIDSQGKIILVAQTPSLTLANAALTPQHCASAPASSASVN